MTASKEFSVILGPLLPGLRELEIASFHLVSNLLPMLIMSSLPVTILFHLIILSDYSWRIVSLSSVGQRNSAGAKRCQSLTSTGLQNLDRCPVESSPASWQCTSCSHSVGHLLDIREPWRHETELCMAKKSRRCGACPDDDTVTPSNEDGAVDRREAAFALVGSLWSLGGAIPTVAVNAAVIASLANKARPAYAAYGEDAKIALPNVLEGMADRVNRQCLVESLGNRECLLYLDPANKLYQGADNQVLLMRLEKSSEALASLPDLIEKKKWSAVVGSLTGPMGSLVVTMNQLTKLSHKPDNAMQLSKVVKLDVLNIGAAAERRQADKALGYTKLATDHLVQFVNSL